MFVSMKWLGRHVDLSGITPEELTDNLTLSTCEVEGLERWAPHMSAVTVGHVLEREQHSGADKLGVCKVDVGAGEPLQIVCGAPNVGPGQRVAVATVGTVLPGNFKIKKSKIRGVESIGMICSVRELDLGDEHDGIWVLPEPNGEPLTVGQPVAEALGMDDWIIEIDNKSLTHRPDLWGHRGLAREVAAIFERELKPLDLSLPALGSGAAFPVTVEDETCSRYVGLGIDGAENGQSPMWLRNLLLAVGQRPIDLFVDLSNFVMLDLGQPNHAFDRPAIGGGGIVVRKARDGESMTTLDAEERALQGADLVIAGADGDAVALAGIMGGEGSKVREGTTELLLECATFDAATVRRTSARLGLRTDSSARFEKTLDPTLPEKAAGHFARLLQELQPGITFPLALSDAGQWTDPATTIHLRGDVVRRDLGADVSDDAIESILTRLELTPTRANGGFDVAVPSARATKDLGIERDLVEEIGRIHRYGNVPEAPLVGAVLPPAFDRRRELVRRLEDRLSGSARFHQQISYSFQTDALLEQCGASKGEFVRVQNPVAPDMARIRRDVLPSLLGLVPAARRLRDEVRLFEVGKGYRPERDGDDPKGWEVHQVALVLAKAPGADGARFDEEALFVLRAVAEDAIRAAGVAVPCWSPGADSPSGAAHPVKQLVGRWSEDGAPAGYVASLEPGVRHALGLTGELDSDVAVCVLDVDALLEAPPAPHTYTPLPKFPSVKVDVACEAPDDVPASALHEAIEQAAKGAARDIELFDVFKGASLGEGKKSLAYHVVLQSDTKTLTDKDANKFLSRLERTLEQKGAALRK
ncbi:MAG: phenylalanine--tRNA ligase subunit beta [Planctomycetota bacterium]